MRQLALVAVFSALAGCATARPRAELAPDQVEHLDHGGGLFLPPLHLRIFGGLPSSNCAGATSPCAASSFTATGTITGATLALTGASITSAAGTIFNFGGVTFQATAAGWVSNSHLIPSTDNGVDLGSASNSWNEGFFDGALQAASLNITGAVAPANGAALPTGNTLGLYTNTVLRVTIDDTKVLVGSPIAYSNAAVTVADDGAGTAAAFTLTQGSNANRSLVQVTCNDANGCALTWSETNASPGAYMLVQNIGAANSITVADSAGVQEVTGASITITVKDYVPFIYTGAQWEQTAAVFALP